MAKYPFANKEHILWSFRAYINLVYLLPVLYGLISNYGVAVNRSIKN